MTDAPAKRVESIDALRGLTIFLMILCSSISWDAGLPAWMFHCQTPPPDYAFHPEIRGLTWVDMVFPIFIFSMGAAFPFALGRKLQQGEPIWKILLYLVKRCAILAFFAIAIGNADAARGSQIASPAVITIFRLGVWGAFFAALVKTSRHWVNIAGWLALAALMAVQHFCLEVPFVPTHRDEIIMILAHVALLGGILWLVSRNSLTIRTLFLVLLVAVRMVGIPFPRIFGWMQYLIIALPASMVGDLIARGVKISPNCPSRCAGTKCSIAAVLAFATFFVQLWGLFVRAVLPDLFITAALALMFTLLTYRERTVFSFAGYVGFLLLLCGIGWDFMDGGLAKEHCNLSFLLVTGGMSALLLCPLFLLEKRSWLPRSLVLSGQNPMIAYTIAWFAIRPLLYAVGFMGWFDAICRTSPFLGLCQGLFVTLLTVWITSFFTHHKIYWRS